MKKKRIKRIICLLLTSILCLGASLNVFAADADAPYKAILNSINAEYNLELGFVSVDSNEVTLEEYKSLLTEIAVQQRELLDYIEKRKLDADTSEVVGTSRSYEQRTRTKTTWDNPLFAITATYTVYNNSKISTYDSSKLIRTGVAGASGIEYYETSTPTYTRLDAGRTLAITHVASYYYEDRPTAVFSNITFYAEFYVSDN